MSIHCSVELSAVTTVSSLKALGFGPIAPSLPGFSAGDVCHFTQNGRKSQKNWSNWGGTFLPFPWYNMKAFEPLTTKPGVTEVTE
jgi:hypothetical protein